MSNAKSYLTGSFFGINSSFFTHSSENNDVGILSLVCKGLCDLISDFALRELNIVLGGTVIRHERKETIIGNVEELIFLAADVGDIHVVSGRAKIFQLLAGEDVNGNEMDFGVAVFAGLRGRHFDDLAGAVLDDDETVLPQSGTLHGIGGRGTGIGALKGVLMLRIVVGHGDK
jgi:hypothetical protein